MTAVNKRLSNAILCILLLIICGIFYFLTRPLSFPSNVYPFLVIGIIFVLTIAVFIKDVLFVKTESLKLPAGVAKKTAVPVIKMFVFSVSYIALIKSIGFYVITTIYLVVALNLLRPESDFTLKNVLISLGISLVFLSLVYTVFNLVLKVPTPEGILF